VQPPRQRSIRKVTIDPERTSVTDWEERQRRKWPEAGLRNVPRRNHKRFLLLGALISSAQYDCGASLTLVNTFLCADLIALIALLPIGIYV
jgi:hypothetical protein